MFLHDTFSSQTASPWQAASIRGSAAYSPEMAFPTNPTRSRFDCHRSVKHQTLSFEINQGFFRQPCVQGSHGPAIRANHDQYRPRTQDINHWIEPLKAAQLDKPVILLDRKARSPIALQTFLLKGPQRSGILPPPKPSCLTTSSLSFNSVLRSLLKRESGRALSWICKNEEVT
jgi:hypothetical protein